MKIRLASALFVTALGLTAAASAADNAARVRQLAGTPEFERVSQTGKKAAFFCVNCHGEDGNSAYDTIPNLAGQNAVYLLNQIDKFADGRRQDEFMTGLIKVLKPEERFSMAIYYSGQPVKPAPAKDAALAGDGRKLYERACKACHGDRGLGNEKIARLAGQQPVYLKKALEDYRAGVKLRRDPVMGSVAKRLKDGDIAALAAYIPTMK